MKLETKFIKELENELEFRKDFELFKLELLNYIFSIIDELKKKQTINAFKESVLTYHEKFVKRIMKILNRTENYQEFEIEENQLTKLPFDINKAFLFNIETEERIR